MKGICILRAFLCAITLTFISLPEIAFCQTITFEKVIRITGREYARDIQPLSGGGYIVAGAQCPGGTCDLIIVRFNEIGDTVWSRTYGEREDTEVATSILESREGGFIVVGWHEDSVSSDLSALALKLDDNGKVEWQRQYLYRRFTLPVSVIENDSGYTLGGYLIGDPFLLNISRDGDSIWLKAISELPEEPFSGSSAYAFDRTDDGGFICAAATYQLDREYVWTYPIIFRTDSVGEILWAKKYPRLIYLHGTYDVQSTRDGGFIASGSFIDTTDSNKIKGLLKVDSQGNTLWMNGWQRIQSVRETSEGGYIFASFATVAGTDAQGTSLWGRAIPSKDIGAVVRPTSDGGFIATTPSDGDIYLVKMDEDGTVTAAANEPLAVETKFALYPNYPNPFNPSTIIQYSLPHAEHVSLSIYDVLGREIVTLVNEKKEAGNYQVTWNADNSPSGIYLCRMRAGGFGEMRKLLLLR